MDRNEIGGLIAARLRAAEWEIKDCFQRASGGIGYFFVDDLLPVELATRIYNCFPSTSSMRLKKSLREYKYIAAQMNRYDPILEETVYAFQDPRVVSLVSSICGIEKLHPDEHLYAGGISLMGNEHFLNPHLDNSHDKDRSLWRVLNLLYYVTPDWSLDNGGNLELWPQGLKRPQITIHSKFNRLVVMATHEGSWHSVSPINCESSSSRCCVSNYYFSPEPLRHGEKFHVTSFRGRPEQLLRDAVLRFDIAARMLVRKVFKRGIVENKHVYKKDA